MIALDPAYYRELVSRALAEDIGTGDVTTEACVEATSRGTGVLVAKSGCVVAGLEIAFEAFRQLDPSVTTTVHVGDGASATPGTVIAEVRAHSRSLLIGERTALNFLQRLSGIATLTRQFVDAARGRITVLDTRKTTPTFRALEKYAVRAGGGTNHRVGLYDAVLIKENHIRLAGGVEEAVRRVRSAAPGLSIEIEAETLEEVNRALAADAPRILVDNMSIAEIREAVARTRGRAEVEISGGVTLERMHELAATGAEYVSVGGLTHSARAADISFEIDRATA